MHDQQLMRWKVICRIIIAITLMSLLTIDLTFAGSSQQSEDIDPLATCQSGKDFFDGGDLENAHRFLELAYSARQNLEFEGTPADGICAQLVGIVRYRRGEQHLALEAFHTALEVFRQLDVDVQVAYTLTSIGAVYNDLGRFSDALENYIEAYTIFEENNDVIRAGEMAGNLATGYERLGQLDKALIYYQEALEVARQQTDLETESIILGNMGNLYRSLGQYNAGIEVYEVAIELGKQSNDPFALANAYAGIGEVYQDQGRFERAELAYKQAQQIYIDQSFPIGQATSFNNLGALALEQGVFSESIANFEQALKIYKDIGARGGIQIAFNNLGSAYQQAGQYGQALETYLQSLEHADSSGDLLAEANVNSNIAVLYREQGEFDKALQHLEIALELYNELTSDETQNVKSRIAAVLVNQSDVYREQKNLSLSEQTIRQALDLYQEIETPKDRAVALNHLANIYVEQNRLDDALSIYMEVLETRMAIKDVVGEGSTLNNLAFVQAELSQYPEALSNYEAALKIHQMTRNLSGEVTTRLNFAQLYYKQNSLAAAIEHFEAVMSLVEGMRANINTEQGRSAILSDQIEVYQSAIGAYLANNDIEAAFRTSEQGRTRTFLDSLQTDYIQLDNSETQSLLREEQELYTQRETLQIELAIASSQNDNTPDLLQDLKQQLMRAENDYAEVVEKIKRQNDTLADLAIQRTQTPIITIETLQSSYVTHQTRLISYFFYSDSLGEQQGGAFILSHDSLTFVALPANQTQIAETIASFRHKTENTPAPATTSLDELESLYNWLITPLLPHLNTDHLIIIPHQVLHYLPFGALSTGENYLDEQFTISYLPSASVLPFLEDKGLGDGNALVFGNPVTDFRALPSAENEATAVADLHDTTPYLTFDATESTLQAEAANASIVHIAAHGQYNEFNPLDSTLHLAADDSNDGNLDVREVFGLGLESADLVILSACETQLGRIKGDNVSDGDEIVGLTRAFMFAGAPSIVSTLWTVEDASTAILMTRFHENLIAGMGEAQALQDAQHHLRSTYSEYSDPYYWAGFVLNGEAGNIIEVATKPPDEPTTVVPTPTPNTPEEPPVSRSFGWGIAVVVVVGIGGAIYLAAVTTWKN